MSETKTLRLRASDLVAPKILKKLQSRSNLVGLGLIAHAWGMIFAAMALFYLFPNPLTFILRRDDYRGAAIGSRRADA